MLSTGSLQRALPLNKNGNKQEGAHWSEHKISSKWELKVHLTFNKGDGRDNSVAPEKSELAQMQGFHCSDTST